MRPPARGTQPWGDTEVGNSKDGTPAMRGRMPLSERAKIFLPFEPLKGFHEALRAKEFEVELAMTEGDGVTRRKRGEEGDLS